MKTVVENGVVVGVELTRRNLEALLAKLDGYPANSACTLFSPGAGPSIYVKAVENAEHYSDRRPGALHEDTEAKVG
jgi:hypothetical protein